MNGVDYTKNLAREREFMRDALSQNNKATEKRVTDMENTHKHIQDKQRDNFIEDRAELEKSHQKSLGHIKEKSSSSMNRESEYFNDKIDKQKSEFQEESIKKRKDFDQRLSDIKNSYKKAFDSEKTNHSEIQETNKDRYNRNIQVRTADHDKSIKEYSERVQHTGSDLKDQYNRERQQLVRAQEDQVSGIYKNERNKQNELTHRIRTEMEKQKEVHGAEKEQAKNYIDSKISRTQKNHTEHSRALAEDYSQKNAELSEKQSASALQNNREHAQQVEKIHRGHATELREVENDRRRRDHDTPEFAEVIRKQHGLSDKSQMEAKNRKLSFLNSQDKVKFEERLAEEQGMYQQDVRTQSAKNAANLQKHSNKTNGEKLIAIASERENAMNKIEAKEKQNISDRNHFHSTINTERKKSYKKLENLKEHFQTSMTAMDERLKNNMEELKRISDADKAEYIKLTSTKHIEDMMDMRREMSKLINMTVENYENRLSEAERENSALKNAMDQKVSDIIEYTDRKLDQQSRLYQQQRKAELNDQKLTQDQRDHEVKGNTGKIISNFQQKLEKMQSQFDSKIKLLTNDYENKLREQTMLNSQEMAKKEVSAKTERENLSRVHQDEKDAIIASFRENIEHLKKNHDDQMQQMKNYNKIS